MLLCVPGGWADESKCDRDGSAHDAYPLGHPLELATAVARGLVPYETSRMAIITISQGTYSGGLALARCLGRELGYRLLSRETLLAEAATRFGLSAAEFEAALAFNPRFLENRAKRHRYVNWVSA